GQRQRHLLRARPVTRRHFGQQQARFEIGKPGRHHEIVGGKLKPQLARRLDEGQILVSERQNGDLRQVDLLLARKHQQQVEWTFKAFHVDDHGGLGGAPISPERSIKFLAAHDHALGCGPLASICANILRAPSVSNSSGPTRAASAASARFAAPAESSGDSLATATISLMSPLQWSTTSQPAANAARLRSAMGPASAFIEISSLISRPLNPIKPRITWLTIVTEVVAGATGAIALNTTGAVIPGGRPASGRKAPKSGASRV